MRFEIRCSCYPFLDDAYAATQEIEVDVICLASDKDPIGGDHIDKVVAARIGLERLQFRGLSEIQIAQTCDAQSEDWSELWAAVFEGRDIRPEIAGDQKLEEIVVIHEAVIHPSLQNNRLAILNAIFQMFSSCCLGVISKTGRGLHDLSMAEIRAINAAHVFHPELLICLPAAGKPRGRRFSEGKKFNVPIEAEEWVNHEWREA